MRNPERRESCAGFRVTDYVLLSLTQGASEHKTGGWPNGAARAAVVVAGRGEEAWPVHGSCRLQRSKEVSQVNTQVVLSGNEKALLNHPFFNLQYHITLFLRR